MKTLDFITITLIIVGALNWGLGGFFNFDLISFIFAGNMRWIARVIFAIVGLCGIYSLTLYGKIDENDAALKNH